MNTYLKKFIEEKFKKPGKALDLGAGDFFDVACLKQLGWKYEGVDIKTGQDFIEIFFNSSTILSISILCIVFISQNIKDYLSRSHLI